MYSYKYTGRAHGRTCVSVAALETRPAVLYFLCDLHPDQEIQAEAALTPVSMLSSILAISSQRRGTMGQAPQSEDSAFDQLEPRRSLRCTAWSRRKV